jgi:hypothetical protein
VVIGWLFATTVGSILIFGFHGDMTGEDPKSLLVASIFNALSRTAWGTVICWVVVACTSGYGGKFIIYIKCGIYWIMNKEIECVEV